MLYLEYAIEGDVSRLRVPTQRPPRRADGLWQHTCCEAFLALPGGSGYFEFNFAPSTEWAAYRFDAYRSGMAAVAVTIAPRVLWRAQPGQLELAVSLKLPEPVPDLIAVPLRLALSAVIETVDGGISYWALRHPTGKPDFHHPDGFTLGLDPPAAT